MEVKTESPFYSPLLQYCEQYLSLYFPVLGQSVNLFINQGKFCTLFPYTNFKF